MILDTDHIVIVKKLVKDELIREQTQGDRKNTRSRVKKLEAILESIRIHEEWQEKKKTLNTRHMTVRPGLSTDPVDW